jgi:hypothetical protein
MSVMGFLLYKSEALLSSDLLTDPRFPGLHGVSGRVRAVLAVPLKVGNRITGMLAVTEARPGRAWTPHDAQLLSIVASNSAAVIEQARLRAESLEKQRLEEESRRMERELEQARAIQMSLVPAGPLALGPWQAVGRVVPARVVGGDAFDYFMLGDGPHGAGDCRRLGQGRAGVAHDGERAGFTARVLRRPPVDPRGDPLRERQRDAEREREVHHPHVRRARSRLRTPPLRERGAQLPDAAPPRRPDRGAEGGRTAGRHLRERGIW